MNGMDDYEKRRRKHSNWIGKNQWEMFYQTNTHTHTNTYLNAKKIHTQTFNNNNKQNRTIYEEIIKTADEIGFSFLWPSTKHEQFFFVVFAWCLKISQFFGENNNNTQEQMNLSTSMPLHTHTHTRVHDG